MKKRAIKILICTENSLYSYYLKNTINEFSSEIEVLTVIDNYMDAVPIMYNEIDFLLDDFNNSIEKSLDFISFLKEEYRNVNIVVLTFFGDLHLNQLLEDREINSILPPY